MKKKNKTKLLTEKELDLYSKKISKELLKVIKENLLSLASKGHSPNELADIAINATSNFSSSIIGRSLRFVKDKNTQRKCLNEIMEHINEHALNIIE